MPSQRIKPNERARRALPLLRELVLLLKAFLPFLGLWDDWDDSWPRHVLI
jgi:hypothetical protein